MSENRDVFRIAFVGDVFLGKQKPTLSNEILKIFASCDATIINQEGPICSSFQCDHKKMLLHSVPESSACLAAWGVTHATLANNHTFDHGVDGFYSTRQALVESGIDFFGAGMNFEEASSSSILKKKDIRIGIISGTEKRTNALLAGENSPGCRSLDRDQLEIDIRQLKMDTNHVLLIPHWGYCDYKFPDSESVSLAEAALDFGTSAVIGHHSHLLHGYRRRIDGRFVAYSLGNFFFDDHFFQVLGMTQKRDELLGAILVLTFNRESITDIDWFFTRQIGTVVLMDQQPDRTILLTQRSLPMTELQNYPRFWKKQVRLRFTRRFLFWLNPLHWKRFRLATIQSLLIMAREFVKKSINIGK